MGVLQFKITLNDSIPAIWRRIHILDKASFYELHCAIRDSMGWEGGHLHEFAITKKKTKRPVLIGRSDPDSMFEVLPENTTFLKDWFGVKVSQSQYVYDFGDNWEHTVLLESTAEEDPQVTYPICLDGKRACPEEDTGGIFRYQRMLTILKDPSHPEYFDVVEWLGEDFDPNFFDAELAKIYIEPDFSIDGFDIEPPDNVDEAYEIIDETENWIPYDAIKFLRNAPENKVLQSKLATVMANAYDDNSLMSMGVTNTSPLWYAIIAETHLHPDLIKSTIQLLVSTEDDWDLMNEQAQHLICLLAEKFPDQVAKETMQAIDAAITLNLKTPYLFLFDVFLVVDSKKYTKWLLACAENPSNYWAAPFSHTLADMNFTDAIPTLEKVVQRIRAEESKGISKNVYFSEADDIEGSLNVLKGKKEPFKDDNIPEYKSRGDWEDYYRKWEHIFTQEEPQPVHNSRTIINPPKIGRNEICPCGSGKKYKKCHGAIS